MAAKTKQGHAKLRSNQYPENSISVFKQQNAIVHRFALSPLSSLVSACGSIHRESELHCFGLVRKLQDLKTTKDNRMLQHRAQMRV